MALRFGAAVHRVVLGRRDGLEILRVVALHAAHEGDAEARGEVRVFAVGLLPAAPARVAEDVDVRRPEGEAVEPRAVAAPLRLVVLGPRLLGDDGRDAAHELLVEGRAEADGLREDRRDAGEGDAVEALIPPVVLGDAEARDGGRGVHHLRDLLFERHPRDEIVNAPGDGERCVFVRGRRRLPAGASLRRSEQAEGAKQRRARGGPTMVFHVWSQ